ncbi:MAG: cysteine--tRNA ligase [Nanoarchaeota archaeon]
MRLYNTLTRKKESLIKGPLKMYSCGPTVYNVPHIGNWRSFIFADILKRYLIRKGYSVKQVMNLTDVDDKTIKGARQHKLSLKDFTEKYAKMFFDDLELLNIMPADEYPRATDFITKMMDMITTLLDKGIAYKGDDGSIYFAIKEFKNYGKLAHLEKTELKAGARVAQDDYDKQHANDFALWKAHSKEDGDVFWEAPFGKGRPGWHIECSVMSTALLGESFDLHTGGVDLIFPHHENEIAQSEATTGKPFVKYWTHCEHLLVDGKKMAKSLGNFYTLEDLIKKGYDPMAIRFLLLATHYRQQLNFTMDGLEYAKNTVSKLQDFVARMKKKAGEGKTAIAKDIDRARKAFEKAMDDDLNISEALAAVQEFTTEMNSKDNDGKLSAGDYQAIHDFMMDLDEVLGLFDVEDEELPKAVKALIDKREEARKKKDFATSDRLREEIRKKGFQVDDTKDGVRWRKIT